MKNERLSLFSIIGAYTLWGLLPLYWKQFQGVPAEVILLQRMFWSIVFLGIVLSIQSRLPQAFSRLLLRSTLKNRLFAAFFLVSNWLVYVWAMGHDRIVEAGLGYFICPLFSVVLAAIIFRERLSQTQLVGVFIVSAGVLLKILGSANIPWVALLVASSWAFYNSVKKARPADPIESLFQEILMAFPLVAIVVYFHNPEQAFFSYGSFKNTLLVFSGPITAVPILMLIYGLKHVPLRHTALIQFLTPTLNVFAALISGEHFAAYDFWAFSVIWIGIAVYLGATGFISGMFRARGKSALNPASAKAL